MSERHSSLRSQSGFTLIELLVVVAIIGIVASIAIPAYRYQILKARSIALVQDLRVIEEAVTEYVADNSMYPPDNSPGREPPQLKEYLHGKVNWNNTKYKYQLDWDYWITSAGKPLHPSTGVLVGISVTTKDKQLVAMMLKVAPAPFKFSLNNNYTYVIEPYVKK